MKIQKLDIALDGDGKNILVADFPTKYTDIKDFFIRALLCGAAGIVLIHNHPGGFSNPSKEDFRVTDKVWAASEFMGIQLYDHIIIGQDSWFSFAKEGKLAVVFSEIPDYNDNR